MASNLKPPPNALDLEDNVLGAILTDKECLAIAIQEIASSDLFYSEANRIIFECAKSLFDKSKPVDVLTVTNELRIVGKLESIGGISYVLDISEKDKQFYNIRQHITILKQKWIKRLLIKISAKNIENAYNDSVDEFELLEKSSFELIKLQQQLSIKQSQGGKIIYKSVIEDIANSMLTPGATGLLSGISEVDQITGGWQTPDLIIIAGRPGMGKTAFAMSAIKNICFNGEKKVLIFSLEMTSKQLMERLIAGDSNISAQKIKKGYINQNEYNEILRSTQHLYSDNIIIDDTPSLSIGQLRAKAMSEKIKNKDLAIIVVDYLQLMKGSGKGNREQEVSEISAGLKSLAKELNIPVMALCQMSRAVESRTGKKPQLSDLRESGSIEQDADEVIFIYRPEYYGVMNYDNGDSTIGMADIIFGKNRHGATGEVTIKFNGSQFKFTSKEEFQKPSQIKLVENNFDMQTGEVFVTPF